MTGWSRHLVIFGALLSAAAVSPGPRPAAAQPVCIPVHEGVDVSFYNNSIGDIFGEAIGQTFLAQDTVVTRLTVWRPPNNRTVFGTHLWITAVDITRTPPRPIASQILLDGPTVYVNDSDPPGQLIEMAFVIDPPLHLPRPGMYAFFLQEPYCNQGESFIIVNSDQNPYRHGDMWLTGRVSYPCHLRAATYGGDPWDLIFDIEYCRPDQTTPARPSSWGQIKARYR